MINWVPVLCQTRVLPLGPVIEVCSFSVSVTLFVCALPRRVAMPVSWYVTGTPQISVEPGRSHVQWIGAACEANADGGRRPMSNAPTPSAMTASRVFARSARTAALRFRPGPETEAVDRFWWAIDQSAPSSRWWLLMIRSTALGSMRYVVSQPPEALKTT